MHIVSNKCFKLDTSLTIRKFYAAANAIYSHTKYLQELPRLSLFGSFTLPVLTYGFDGLLMSLTDLNKLNVCCNSVCRKIFGMHMWDSVKCVQLYCERLDLIRIVHKRNLDLFSGLFHTSNCVIRECIGLLRRSRRFKNLCNEYDVVICSESLGYNVFDRFRIICGNYSFVFCLSVCLPACHVHQSWNWVTGSLGQWVIWVICLGWVTGSSL